MILNVVGYLKQRQPRVRSRNHLAIVVNAFDHEPIVGARRMVHLISVIVSQLEFPRSTVLRVFQEYMDGGQLALTVCGERRLRGILYHIGFGSRRPTRVPLLNARHRAARLAWAREDRDWSVEDWKRVTWSDESRFRLLNPDVRLRVWCQAHEVMYPACQFFFDKGKNASQAAEIVNGVYGADTVTVNYVQFGFRLIRSGIFYANDAPRTGMPVVENVDKITEIIVDQHRLTRNVQNWPTEEVLMFDPDNARPHAYVVTRQKPWELSWEVLMYPPYSTDLAPSDYHLLLALQNFLSNKKLESREDCADLDF
ncbi:HTH_Tnp_Tc3_2 domain-containing protein [Trichonephila clavipes]|nr:HTH_Tnp_Tc3_2 domain-containing protein [Trichonephila clavipes]